MVLSPVTEEEVANVIQRLNTKKSCDVNGMSVWLIKQCYKHILTPLTKLINKSFESGVFPAQLKTAKVIPIYKKDDPCLASNYRPISILPVLSKIFEKVFYERFVKFLIKFDVLSPDQFGFMKNRSTIDAVTTLVEAIVESLDKNEELLAVFLDLSKAFDRVHHDILIHKLKASGIRGLPLKWLKSYLTGRDQFVEIGNSRSTKLPMNQGVPQGSILGPILFLVYVNDLDTSIQNGEVVQYADDTTLFCKAKTKEELEIQSFIEVNSCIQYFTEINLPTNNSKTNYINFCIRQQESEYRPAVMVDETLLEEVESTRFLGMHLDRGLTWNNHVDYICARVASGIYALRKLAKFCSLNVLKMAYFGLIYPHLAYGISLWGGCAKFRLERVFRLQKKAIRILAKLNPRESCHDAFRELELLTLPCLYVLEVSLYCRFRCGLTQGRDIHSYNTRGRDTYRTQQHRTSAFEQTPSYAGAKFINMLPRSIKDTIEPKKFKARLKDLLVSKAFYSVDEFSSCRWDD